MTSPFIFISAGEASGDAHGAGVVAELRKRFPEAELFGIGDDHMQAAEYLRECIWRGWKRRGEWRRGRWC